MEIFVDTETTGKALDFKAPMSAVDNWPRLVQVGYIVYLDKVPLTSAEMIAYPDGWEIPVEASNIHGITTEKALRVGIPIRNILGELTFWIGVCGTVVGHNLDFDMNVIGAECYRLDIDNPFEGKKVICTMKSTTNFCQLPKVNSRYPGYKYPKLSELYFKLFQQDMGEAHTALQDITNTATCYYELVRRGILKG